MYKPLLFRSWSGLVSFNSSPLLRIKTLSENKVVVLCPVNWSIGLHCGNYCILDTTFTAFSSKCTSTYSVVLKVFCIRNIFLLILRWGLNFTDNCFLHIWFLSFWKWISRRVLYNHCQIILSRLLLWHTSYHGCTYFR